MVLKPMLVLYKQITPFFLSHAYPHNIPLYFLYSVIKKPICMYSIYVMDN